MNAPVNAPFKYDPPLVPFLDVLYQDDAIMVVIKPSGLLSVPGRLPQYHDSVLSRVRSSYPEAQAVHRLDLGTSGVLVVGLCKEAISKLGKQFMQRETKKVYIAQVAGLMSGSGHIDLPLRTDWENRPYQIVDFKDGRPAQTDYEVIGINETRQTSLVRLHPLTGRSHQLRVHLKEQGHPILGDHLYAPQEVFKASPRLNLHARYLSFRHPISDDIMEFECTTDFEQAFWSTGGVA
ncbi:MAG: RNA pseudouridine synthase [Candidatus Anaerobiospirillum merdipullorum]|uniref:Dual-specificity RNA pseudouridine synthase RluA n=1 Tax=Candidatus Anaerobiospirillum merdipullorum TaxID=2838450 RepID=A0A9E2NS29_9GAMM|nr:RNA pseudouridine synthase [Candidatus Anaerobiospirillum merdipullorum]